MKRSCVVSLVVAALALVAVSGCKSTPPGGQGGGKVKEHVDGGQLSPPGLSPGVVQIMKTPAGGLPMLIGYAVSDGASELWFLKVGVAYPVPLTNPGDMLTFLYVGPVDASIDPNHDGVTAAELCACPQVQSLKPGVIRRITESMVVELQCP